MLSFVIEAHLDFFPENSTSNCPLASASHEAGGRADRQARFVCTFFLLQVKASIFPTRGYFPRKTQALAEGEKFEEKKDPTSTKQNLKSTQVIQATSETCPISFQKETLRLFSYSWQWNAVQQNAEQEIVP